VSQVTAAIFHCTDGWSDLCSASLLAFLAGYCIEMLTIKLNSGLPASM